MAKQNTTILIIAGLALLLLVVGGNTSSGAVPSAGSGSTSGNDLHPNLIPLFNQTLAQANAALPSGVTISVDSTFRSFDEQAADYAQGRTAPGSIITDAQPGYSYHNYGLAFDFSINDNGSHYYPASYSSSLNNSNWMTVVNIFKSAGFQWGGDWNSFKDYDHLQYTYGFAVSDLLNLYNQGDFVSSPYNSNNYVNLSDA